MTWWAAGAAVLAPVFAALWYVQTRTRDASHVDVGWAAGLGFMGLLCAALGDGDPGRRALVAAMASLWSARLAWHLYADRVRGKPEDGRYASLRASWGPAANRNFFVFFQAQGLLDLLLALPFAALCARESPLGPADLAGASIWLVAVSGEAVADRQLAAFRADPGNKGKTCRAGLWRYSRHPNYFFEWSHWLAYAAMAPEDWRVWTAPALMLYFLLRVTGIPATEAQALRSRGDDYRRYQEETSAFVPWFPRGGRVSPGIALAERGYLPDALVRAGIRALLAERLRAEEQGGEARQAAFRASLATGPVAPVPAKANEQHYELPAAFMALALGPRMKYSSCLYETGRETLAQAEEAMLALTCERAGLADGQDVLELGCGWGSLTLWMAQRYPKARITAVSNSASQREFILARARERGLGNVTALTADMNAFAAPGLYDRVVSVEMFEHMRNYPELLRRVASWLKPDGKLFVHIFCHKAYAYPFVDEGADDWMARHFFTGGCMPSEGLLLGYQQHLVHEKMWVVDGRHYEKTSNHWLDGLDRRRDEALEALRPVYGADAALWLRRWRIFYMSCAELFGYADGSQWRVAHYLFRKRA